MYYYCTTIFNFLVSKGFKNGIRVNQSIFLLHKWPSSKKENNEHLSQKHSGHQDKWCKNENKQMKISFAIKKSLSIDFQKNFHLLFLKKFSPLCKNKQDFFVNSHSLIRGRTFFGAILICIKNKYDYKIMWKKNVADHQNTSFFVKSISRKF